ncbi:hypothetical protein V8D89_006390 [Ganoderma adspersum]
MSVDDKSQPRSGRRAQASGMEQLQIRDVIRPSGTQSISRLPAELFVQIMKEVYLLLEALPADRPDRHTDWTNPYQLLWQEIRVSQHPEWLELCLARCAGALASVHATHAHYPPETSATLRRHVSSIKACHIFSDHDSLSALSSLLSTPMPALETLTLRHNPFEDIADVPVTFDLPRLSTLSLTNWQVPRDAAVFTSLRSLTLIDTLWPSSFDHFLDVMENTRNLEHLDLDLVMLYRHHDILANLQTWPTAHLGQNLIAIMDVFSVASVDTLEVDGRPDRATADTWQRVFQGGTFDNLWHGLELATAAAVAHDGVVCCPFLSAFLSEVTADDWSDTVAPEFYAPAKLLEATRRALSRQAGPPEARVAPAPGEGAIAQPPRLNLYFKRGHFYICFSAALTYETRGMQSVGDEQAQVRCFTQWAHAPRFRHSQEPRAQNRGPLNNGQLIGNLPPELFVQILENVYWLLRKKGITWDTNWTVPYQLVCRRWRDVISSTPQFWQDISVKSSPRWLDFCLTRCAGAPATVNVWHPTSPDATFATLCSHASAIRACYVHCDVSSMDYLAGLPLLLATPMPALEALLINGPYHEDETLDVPLTHDLVPRLTSLELWNSIAPRDTAVYTSLRRLTFFGTTWTISYDKFLDVIGECHDLQYLRLDEEVLDPFAAELVDLSPPRPPTQAGNRRRTTPLVLPRLGALLLTGQSEVLFHLLATIHAPQATKVILTINPDDDEQGPGPLLTLLLAPNPHQRIPFLSSLRSVSLSCWDGDPFQLSLRGEPGPDGNAPLLSVDYGMVHNELWPGNAYLERNLVAIMDLFPLAAVDTLEVVGCLDQVAAGTWQRVFEGFSPGLRVLHVKGRGTLDSLWRGLERATMASLEHGAGAGAVCCPSLSEIGIDDRPRVASRFKFAATAQFYTIVCKTLRLRADRGGTRLKKLHLYLEFTDEAWSQACEFYLDFMEEVGDLVEEPVYYRDGRT